MHVLTLVHTDPRNHERFQKWINSLDFGSRPFCREVRLYDIAVQEKHLDKLLEHLKRYYKGAMIGSGEYTTGKIQKMIRWVMKFFKLKPVYIENVEEIPKKWFKPINFAHGCTHSCYIFPIGSYPDKKDKGNKNRNDMI
jgi:hypothetical protein